MEADLRAWGVDVISLDELGRKHSRFKSFKLSIKKDDQEKIDDASFWPPNVKVRRYFAPQCPRASDDDNAARDGMSSLNA